MKKINWKIYKKDRELWLIVALIISTAYIYSYESSVVWLVCLALWIVNIYIRLKYLSRLAVGGAVKESTDE